MKIKKLICLLLCLCFLTGAVNSSGVLMVAAQTEEELQADIDAIDQEIADNEQLLEEVAQSAEEQKAELDKLEKQIDEIEGEASKVQSQIHEINGEIKLLTADYHKLKGEIEEKNKSILKTSEIIKTNEEHIENNKTLLASKLRSAYMNGNESTLKILMGADSLASFLTRLELMKRTSENDKKTIDNFKEKVSNLKKAKKKLENDKAVIVENQKKVVETRAEYTEQKRVLQTKQNEYSGMVAEIEQQYARVEAYVESLDKEGAAYQSYISDLERQRAEAGEALDEFINNYIQNNAPLNSENNEVGGSSSGSSYYESNDDWVWPVGGASYYITSVFGYRDSVLGTNPYHGAVDISGSGFYGTSIYAARAGTVIKSSDDGDGYGYCVVIDHGDGFISLYAHNSLNVVSVGEYVGKGQLIAYAGSTGASTGAHLHYEIRYNGEKVDPALYHPGMI